jgi:Protein of unknown function (DUF992)
VAKDRTKSKDKLGRSDRYPSDYGDREREEYEEGSWVAGDKRQGREGQSKGYGGSGGKGTGNANLLCFLAGRASSLWAGPQAVVVRQVTAGVFRCGKQSWMKRTKLCGSPRSLAGSDRHRGRARCRLVRGRMRICEAFGRVAERSAAMRYAILICASLLGLMATAAVSAEKVPVNLGVLTCTLIKPMQEAAHKMTCGFRPAGARAEEKYTGTIRESAKDLPSGKVVLIWAVLGPAEGNMRAGILAQRYVKGSSAPGQAPTLKGERNPAIVLQFETNDGAAAYDTISLLDLELTGTPA